MKTKLNLSKNREKNRRWYKKNIEKAREHSRKYRKNHVNKRKAGRWKELGIINSDLSPFTMRDFTQFFKLQKNQCKICSKSQNNFDRLLDVDHNHKTGIVRGLICRSCNLKLGHYEKDKTFYKKAELYLKVTK